MNFLENLIQRENQRKLYLRIQDDHILTDGYAGNNLVADTTYFEIRLTEMYLHNRQQIWRGFIPLGMAVTDFLYSNMKQSVPFFVGNQIMKNFDQYLEGKFVEYRNTRVAGPFPYLGGDIGLFVGLFRLEVTNLVKGLFGVLDSLATSFNISQLSSYLNIAKPLSKELLPLLGMEEVHQQFGIREEFSGPLLKEGYLVYGNISHDDKLKKSLWINKDGRLMHGSEVGALKDVTHFDYAVIHVKQDAARDDLTLLPFYETWRTTRGLLSKGEENKAKNSFTEMIRQLAVSTDLTEEHRYALILLYKTKYEWERELLLGVLPSRSVTRGRGDSKSVKELGLSLLDTARIAEKAGYGKNVWGPFAQLSRQWQRIPDLKAPSLEEEPCQEQETALLWQQLDSMKTFIPAKRPDPTALAEAVTITVYQTE